MAPQRTPAARAPAARLIALLKELDAARKITRQRAQAIYGRPISDATWKRIKKRLESEGCRLRWDPNSRTFFVADPLWSMERGTHGGDRRGRLAVLRAAAAALGAPYSDALVPLFERWDAELAGGAPHVDGAAPHRPQPRADEGFYERLTVVECALRDKRMLRFAYTPTTGGASKERQIEPYALHDYAGRFYVWGRERVRQAPKFFALDLMRDVVLEDRFDPDPSLRLDDALAHSFGMFVRPGTRPLKIIVEVDPERAAYVRARRWPAEISLQDLKDGALRIAFSVTDPHEIVAWVLSFGGSARIVEPASAADLARRAAEAIAERHAWAKRAPKGEGLLAFDWSKES